MSDPHFTVSGDVLGHDPKIRLSAAIGYINTHHSDSAFCVISGDLVNRGSSEDYTALKENLDQLSIPCMPMVGNHDDRELLKSTFQFPENCMKDFIQYSLSTSEGLIICLDTQKTGSDAGEFCKTRSEWLESVLVNANDTPVYLFMHHPPVPLGLPMQDVDCMQDGGAFLDMIKAFPNIKHMFIGHVHRPICGTMRGIPYATMRSILYQAPPPQPDWDWESFVPAREAPYLGVLTIKNSDVCLKYTQFCHYEIGT